MALTRAVTGAVPVPVIASGGVGTLDHLVEGIRDGGASAVLAASIFHFGEFTIAEAKEHMARAGLPVRRDASPVLVGVPSRCTDSAHGQHGARVMTRFTLDDLAAIIAARANASATASYTKSLLDAGPARAAKKLGEEAVETVIAAVQGDAVRPSPAKARICFIICSSSCIKGAFHSPMSAPSSNIAPAAPATRKKPPARPILHRPRTKWTHARTRPRLSPYHRFTRSEWAALRADTPLTLSVEDLSRLRSLNDPISLEEVVAIYLPLSRLLALICRGDARPL